MRAAIVPGIGFGDYMSLRDLDELILTCRNEEGRGYIAEAVACYRAGAYRACIVSTWIAVVFDLISKVRELALSGDAEAQAIIDDLNRWQPLIGKGDMGAIKKSLDLERSIVELVNAKFVFFEGLQVQDLERLHDDRNRCAHPTYQGTEQPYAPSAELARTHLVDAVRHVLSQAPVQGKAATAQIIKLVESAYFPTDPETAKLQLKAAGLDRARDSLFRSVADHLVFGLLEGSASLKGRAQTATALRAVCELHPLACEPRVKKALNLICRRAQDPTLPLFVALQRHLSQAWNFLEADNQARLKEVVRRMDDGIAVRVLPASAEIPDLNEAVKERAKKLTPKQLGLIVEKSKHPIFVQAGVDVYCESHSWDDANTNYSVVIEPVLADLTEVQIKRILNASVEESADLRGSHSFNNFCRYIYENEKLPKAEIVASLTGQGMGHLATQLESAPDDIPF
ncbi:hypothetical protein ACQR1W_08655 [Bradyrhizobium sp. HKCCYLS1011]|uniref:hypothetical protein n=1 Tax=Bradyrhizobium sp. HKCCYLS1011 TaxID=3420733 RepID=UPI003EB6B10B